jgi:myo-inositol-1(or 4)-monophosphatase
MAGTAASGDTTFAIDNIAEDAIITFIKKHNLSIVYYSEDKGLMQFGENPTGTLVIDPIDGTRPAMAGFEQCVVSVAWAENKPNATLGDVRYGCIADLKLDDIYLAVRGEGVRWIGADGSEKTTKLLPITEIGKAPLTFELAARPARYVSEALGDIMDACSLNGGCFTICSTAYSLTRLVTGQLAAVLDAGPKIYFDIPETRVDFERLGFGKMIGIFTYDLAAAALIAEEGGAIVTDANGDKIDSHPLLDTSTRNVISLCAATTPELHSALLKSIGDGVDRLHKKITE